MGARSATRREAVVGRLRSVSAKVLLLSLVAGVAKAFTDVGGPLASYEEAAGAVQDAITAGRRVSAEQVAAVEHAQEAFDGPLDALTGQINTIVGHTTQQATDRAGRDRRNML